MSFTAVFAGLVVADHDASRAWYERLLGRPPDLIPNDHESCWRLTGDGWLYIAADGGHAGGGLFTALVDDLDGLLAGMRDRGIEPERFDTNPGPTYTAWVTDPDGNRLQFAQPPQDG